MKFIYFHLRKYIKSIFYFVNCCRFWKKNCWISKKCQRLKKICLRKSLCWKKLWSANDAQTTIHSTIQISIIKKNKKKIKIKFNNNFNNNNNKINSIKTFSMTMNAIRVQRTNENVKKKHIQIAILWLW